MTSRERINAVLNFRRPDRLPVIEWASWWDQTVNRWRNQGLPQGIDGFELQQYFDLDVLVQSWYSPRAAELPGPAEHGGAVLATVEDYRRARKAGLLYPEPDFSTFERYHAAREEGNLSFWFTLEGFFWYPRTLFGIENHLFAFYDEPELMHEMNRDQAEYSLRLLEQLLRRWKPEFMTFAEDMSYNHGPMISEELFDEFMLPYYRMITPLLHENGVKVFVDSDGDIMPCIPWFKRAGIEGILPLERQAGVDVAKLRQEHPDFLLMGAFDKMTMDKGEARMRQEFERLMPVARQGGFAFGCDHQTPPAVSLEDYRLYLKLFREYAEKI